MVELLRFSFSPRRFHPSYSRRFLFIFGFTGIILLSAVPDLLAARVHVPEGTFISLSLRSDVTTDNVVKGDRVDFDVTDNVVVDNYVVIPKGAIGWATVVKVKGAGKNAKDASVTLRIIGVYAADKQPIPLRLMPNKSKKLDPTDNNFEESSTFPGPDGPTVGAPKGKQYAAYTDSEAFVETSESASASAAPADLPQALPAAAPPASSAAPAAAAVSAPEPASVDFRSDPTGGEIIVDGSSVGITPNTLPLTPGLHDIEIYEAGFQRWKRKLRVAPGSHPTVLAHLVKE
jgi:PEGA domain